MQADQLQAEYFVMTYVGITAICMIVWLLFHTNFRLPRSASFSSPSELSKISEEFSINYLMILTFLIKYGMMLEFKTMVMIATIEWMLFGATYLC